MNWKNIFRNTFTILAITVLLIVSISIATHTKDADMSVLAQDTFATSE